MSTTKDEVKFRTNSDYAVDWLNGRLQYVWRDGEIMVFDPKPVSAENTERATAYGFEVRLERSMAVEIEKFPGKAERTAEKKRRLKATIEHLMSGSADWEMKRAGGGLAFDGGIVIQALMRVLGVDLDGVNAKVAAYCEAKSVEREAALKTLATSPDVIEAVGKIRAERAQANSKVDPLAMLRELG